MSNPNPNQSGLNRSGRKPVRRVRLDTKIDPLVLEMLQAIALRQGWKFNYTLEQYLKCSLGMPTDYNRGDLELIAKGAPIE